MKLVLAIVNDEDANRVITGLSKKGFGVTKLAATGGFLKAGNVTILIGTEDEKVESVIEIIKEKSDEYNIVGIIDDNKSKIGNDSDRSAVGMQQLSH